MMVRDTLELRDRARDFLMLVNAVRGRVLRPDYPTDAGLPTMDDFVPGVLTMRQVVAIRSASSEVLSEAMAVARKAG